MMRFKIVSACFARTAAVTLLAATYFSSASAQNPAQSTPAQSGPVLLPAPDSARINALAHKLLAAALNKNGLGGNELKPWHMKIDYSLLSSYGPIDQRGGTGGSRGPARTAIRVGGGTAGMAHGTVEEWHAARYQWGRTYASATDTWNGSEWRASHVERYQARPKHLDFASELLNLRVVQPIINPLYQVSLLPANAQLTITRLTAGNDKFNCVAIANPEAFGTEASAEWIMPTLCFDSDLRLRLVSAKDTAVQFEDFQPFQGREVARTARVIWRGTLDSEMKITELEDFDPAANPAPLKPSADAALQPYTIEAGDPPLEPIHEEGTTIPLLPDGTPYRGPIAVFAIIRKDGSVKVGPSHAGPLQALTDAASMAVSKWKYKPYLIDGEPVEVRVSIPYLVDGKPFIPSYERAGRAQGTYTP